VLGTDLDVSLDGLMLFSLFSGVVAFTLLFIWLVLHRSRMLTMIDLAGERALDEALASRISEGGEKRA
jgi:heme exporter protein C